MNEYLYVIMTLFGAGFTIILGLIGWIMSGIRKDLKDLWKAVTELNNSLLRDYATKVELILIRKDVSEICDDLSNLEKTVAVMGKE